MRVTWNNDKRQFLQTFCKDYSDRELAELFRIRYGLTVTADRIHGARLRYGIKSGRDGRFQKGHTPFNKGKPFQASGRSVANQFKPGHRPQTWVPVGTEAIDKDGYLKRKVRDDAPPGMSRKNWKFVHVLKWEEYNGRVVPPKHVVRLKDGNKRNFAPENLAMISMGENAVLNKLFAMPNPPPGGFDVLLNLARLNMATTKRKRELAS